MGNPLAPVGMIAAVVADLGILQILNQEAVVDRLQGLVGMAGRSE